MSLAPSAPLAARRFSLADEPPTLVPGVALDLFGAPARRLDTVQLSAGTRRADGAGPMGYAERSFVPRPPWRMPDDDEWAALTESDEGLDPPGDRIAVFAVPASLLEPFAQLRALCYEADNLKRLRAVSDDVVGRTALLEAARYARSLTRPERSDLEGPGLHANVPPGTPTMTTGHDRQLTGLHVDSWYRRGIEGRASSPNRISVNLGVHDRHLLYLNLPLRMIAARVAEARGGAAVEDISFALPREFMRFFPDYPVVKLTVAPGEAYIAPTENIVHDGYQERSGGIDLQFTCRGHFRAPARR